LIFPTMTDVEAPRQNSASGGAGGGSSSADINKDGIYECGSISVQEVSVTRRPLRRRIMAVIWDSLDKTPEERAFIAKIDWWILSYCCIAYFVKYLDQTNVSGRFLHFAVSHIFYVFLGNSYLSSYHVLHWN
jgi:hypothetical protein